MLSQYVRTSAKHAASLLPGLVVFAIVASGCGAESEGGGAGVPVSNDPRCAAICTDEQPEFAGAYDVCSGETLAQCVDLCEVRIEGADNLCSECLLEGAYLDAPSGIRFDQCTDDRTCYVGIPRFCINGCWVDHVGTDCSAGTCDNAQDEYEAQVAAGFACAYTAGDEQGRAACHAEVQPREEVACEVEFESVTACADLCR